MHKDIAFVLKIPFESKKAFFPKKNSKYFYKGDVYYLLDKKGYVLRDFMIVDEELLEYRPNDNAMMIGEGGKGTVFWKQKEDQRLKIFPKSPINFEVKTASIDEIKKLNDYSFEHTNTALTLEGMISGSNTSGSDSRIDATPIISTDAVFYGMRFVNAFKKLRKVKHNKNANIKYPIKIGEFNTLVKLSLSEYLEHFKFAKREFYRYNPESYNIIYKDSDDITQNLYFLEFKKNDLNKELQSYKDMATTIIEKYNSDIIKRELAINRLRGILRGLLLVEKHQKQKDPVIGREEKDSNLDAAHLYDVRWIKSASDSELWRIADINNGLLLPKDLHWKFDKDKEFNLDSSFEFIENNKKTNIKIDPSYITEDRKYYINLRNKRVN